MVVISRYHVTPFQKSPILLTREIILLGIVLALAHTLDGVLTMMGIGQFGVRIEGNVFLRSLMTDCDPFHVLAFTKIGAILAVLALAFFSTRVRWIGKAMALVCGISLGSAVIPWLYVAGRYLL